MAQLDTIKFDHIAFRLCKVAFLCAVMVVMVSCMADYHGVEPPSRKGDNPKGNGGGRLDPNALRIIDTQDAHSTKNRNVSEVNWDDNLVPK